ncbi:MAG: hypothetical protein V3W02_01220 [Gammaproteobacteria bacterium]
MHELTSSNACLLGIKSYADGIASGVQATYDELTEGRRYCANVRLHSNWLARIGKTKVQ